MKRRKVREHRCPRCGNAEFVPAELRWVDDPSIRGVRHIPIRDWNRKYGLALGNPFWMDQVVLSFPTTLGRHYDLAVAMPVILCEQCGSMGYTTDPDPYKPHRVTVLSQVPR